MKIKTSDLTGAALDWAVGKAEGLKLRVSKVCNPGNKVFRETRLGDFAYSPSESWVRAGEIIERETIVLTHPKYDCWTATAPDSTDLDTPLYEEDGPTPLIAACRCYVASKLGDEVEVPDELVS